MQLALRVRGVIIDKFQLVAVAEVLYTYIIQQITAIEGYMRVFAYITDHVLRTAQMKTDCMHEFLRKGDEKFLDFLISLPNLFTSLLDFKDTSESGYANLACARTTHMNHIYAGSLKQYVFASAACAATFASEDRTKYGQIPACAYRDDNKTTQDESTTDLIIHHRRRLIDHLWHSGRSIWESRPISLHVPGLRSIFTSPMQAAETLRHHTKRPTRAHGAVTLALCALL
jgi:hypothetical protein